MKNIKDFTPTDLDGNKLPIDGLASLIGNEVYFSARDLSLLDTAKKIYNKQDFESSPELIDTISATQRIAPWLKQQFVDFLCS